MKRLIMFFVMLAGMAISADIVLTDWANLRSAPGVSGEILAKVKPGTYAFTEATGGWTKISVAGQVGKVGTKCINGRVISGQGCKFFALDGTDQGVLKGGTECTSAEVIKTWFFIQYDGKSGYVYKGE